MFEMFVSVNQNSANGCIITPIKIKNHALSYFSSLSIDFGRLRLAKNCYANVEFIGKISS